MAALVINVTSLHACKVYVTPSPGNLALLPPSSFITGQRRLGSYNDKFVSLCRQFSTVLNLIVLSKMWQKKLLVSWIEVLSNNVMKCLCQNKCSVHAPYFMLICQIFVARHPQDQYRSHMETCLWVTSATANAHGNQNQLFPHNSVLQRCAAVSLVYICFPH